MSLPLSLAIAANDKSLVDNEGTVRNIGAVGGWGQKTRAVASLQTRMRVVASFEDLDSRESMVLDVLVALRSVCSEL